MSELKAIGRVDVRYVESGDCLVMRWAGELDMATEAVVDRAVSDVLETGRRIVIDLTGVTFIDCSTLRVLRKLRARLEGTDLTATLVVGGNALVQRFLELAGEKSDSHLVWATTVEMALSA